MDDEPEYWIVTWGTGGFGSTNPGLTREQAADVMRDAGAWGPVLVYRDRDGIPRWASNGHPLPEGDATREYLMSVFPAGEPGVWQADDTGIQSGGDIGGDIQAGESYSVRYCRAGRPFAMITRTAYPVEYDESPCEFAVQVQTEWLVCGEPLYPGGTEIWSDYAYDDEPGIYGTAADAEEAALEVATELLDDAGSHDWDGLPPWENGEAAHEET